MYSLFKNLHSYLAYLAVLGVLIGVLVAAAGLTSRRPFADRDRKLALIGLIGSHLQLLIGLVLYLFLSPKGVTSLSGEAMKNRDLRLYVLEHPLTMLIAIVLITIGYSRAKRQLGSTQGFRTLLIFYGVGLVLVLSRIPWRAWFDGQ